LAEWHLVEQRSVGARVARWFILRPKIPIGVYFGGLWMKNFGIFM
jgi:hypothetical protein